MLSFMDNAHRTRHTGHFLQFVKIKNYNILIDVRNFFDQLQKNLARTYNNIWKITTEQEDDYITGCLLDYTYCKEH